MSVGRMVIGFAREEWMDDGACRGVDPDLFFPERGGPTSPAKQVCAGCPVREPCLNMALEQNIKFGIWGGTSDRERRRIRRERGLAGPPPRRSIAEYNRERRAELKARLSVVRDNGQTWGPPGDRSSTAPWEHKA